MKITYTTEGIIPVRRNCLRCDLPMAAHPAPAAVCPDQAVEVETYNSTYLFLYSARDWAQYQLLATPAGPAGSWWVYQMTGDGRLHEKANWSGPLVLLDFNPDAFVGLVGGVLRLLAAEPYAHHLPVTWTTSPVVQVTARRDVKPLALRR